METLKKHAIEHRRKIRQVNWKKKYKKEALKETPLKFRKNRKDYVKPKITDTPKSIYLFSDSGTGKTVYAAFVFLSFIKQIYFSKGSFTRLTYCFVNVPDLFTELQKNFKNGEYFNIYEKYLDCDILVLDEFAFKKATDWVVDVMYHIINKRDEEEKITIITSNLAPKEAANQLGDDRIIRRITETYLVVKKEHWKKLK